MPYAAALGNSRNCAFSRSKSTGLVMNSEAPNSLGPPPPLVVAIGGHHHHRQIGVSHLDLAKQRQPVHSRHVDVGQDHDQLRLDAAHQPVQRFLAGVGEVHGVSPLPHLAAKALAEQLGDIALVVDHQMLTVMPQLRPPRRRGRRMVNSV